MCLLAERALALTLSATLIRQLRVARHVHCVCPHTNHALRSFKMLHLFSRFLRDTSGATSIEYGLIAALISVMLITGATAIGGSLDATFSTVAGFLGG